jgi:hypothetical protein
MAETPKLKTVVAVLWPAFMVAAAATVVFFTVFDPHDLFAAHGLQVSRLGGYTVGFFLFWMLTSLSSLLTCYFQRPCEGAGRAEHRE